MPSTSDERRLAPDLLAYRAGVSLVADRWIRIGLLVAWTVVVLLLVRYHVYWRDEVRALSFARQGDSVWGMVQALHGEGHPALWYVLLRGLDLLFGNVALPLLAFGVTFLAFLLLVLRAPFGWPVIGLILFSGFGLYEYVVMARNYGISMLLLFCLAAAYERHRRQGVLLGVLLFLLANTNVHSVVLAGAFLLFWLADTIAETGWRWTPPLKTCLYNTPIAAAGVLTCYLEIHPLFNDAAVIPAASRPSPLMTLLNILVPGDVLPGLLGPVPATTQIVAAALLLAAIAGLVRRPAAMLATAAALMAFSGLFALVYPADYRRQCLWLAFLIGMYWIVGRQRRCSGSLVRRVLATVGGAAFLAILAMQLPAGLHAMADVAHRAPPASRVRDLAALIGADPALRDATVIADPDYLVEALPYYASNPTYLIREDRDGPIVKFTTRARLDISLDDVLATARRLNAERRRPVLILLSARLGHITSRRNQGGIRLDDSLGCQSNRALRESNAPDRVIRPGPRATRAMMFTSSMLRMG